MRQQRSGYNPTHDKVVHAKDGIIVDQPTRAGEYLPATGGWADASDYLQYVTTSATATYQLLQAWRDNPKVFGDDHLADGRPGTNGVPDVLDEARHGLAWLLLFPDDSLMPNQLGDDRDHMFFDLIYNDSADYGWGKGGPRPLYPCTGIPQGAGWTDIAPQVVPILVFIAFAAVVAMKRYTADARLSPRRSLRRANRRRGTLAA